MDWKEKFAVVAACLETHEEIEQDFYIQPEGAPADLITKVRADFPFVSDDYLQFLALTNGADIAQCRLVEGEGLESMPEQYGDVYPKECWLPFGWEAGGDPLLLHESGKVAIGEGKSNDEAVEFAADSFADFLSNVLMGQRYAATYRIPDEEQLEFYHTEIDEDPWLTFLVEQKWVRLS